MTCVNDLAPMGQVSGIGVCKQSLFQTGETGRGKDFVKMKGGIQGREVCKRIVGKNETHIDAVRSTAIVVAITSAVDVTNPAGGVGGKILGLEGDVGLGQGEDDRDQGKDSGDDVRNNHLA